MKTFLLVSILLCSFTLASDAAISPLLVFEKTKSACEVKVQKVTESTGKLWFRMSECPCEYKGCSYEAESVVFDQPNNRVLVVGKEKIFTADLKLNSELKEFTKSFKQPIEGNLDSSLTWIDKKSHALKTAYVIVPPHDLKDNPKGDEWRKRFPLLKDSWISTHEEGEGEPAIAVVAELKTSGDWKILASKKTTTGAASALGLSVVKDFITESKKVNSLSHFFMEPICEVQKCSLDGLKQNGPVKSWIEQEFPEGAGYMAMGKSDGFIFGVGIGDTFHGQPPLYYCKNNCEKRVPVEVPSDNGTQQISLSPNSNFMFISSEYHGTNAKLYKTGSEKPVISFTYDSRVLWLPKDLETSLFGGH